MYKPFPKLCRIFFALMLSSLLVTSNIVSAAVLDAGRFICGIQADNTLVCWGGGDTPPSGTFYQVNIGTLEGCGIRTDNTLVCWDSKNKESAYPSGTFYQVSVGNRHTCGIKTDNIVECWGSNKDGQAAPPTGMFSQISAGSRFTCGIQKDNKALDCWGTFEEPGRSYTDEFPGGTFSNISASPYHICGIRIDKTTACWGPKILEGGEEVSSKRGDGRAVPPSSGTFSQVSGGIAWFTCWLRTDNAVLCSGANEFEESENLRAPNSTCICEQLRPGCLCESESGIFSHISAGNGITCAIKMDNTVICWGRGENGGLIPPAGLIVKSSDPDTCLLYGVHNNESETKFFIINSNTSKVHVRSRLNKNYNITALDSHLQTNQVYAASSRSADSKSNGYLYKTLNGAQSLKEVGKTRFQEIEGLAFHPDGTLWGWAQDGGLFQIKNGENNEPDPNATEVILSYNKKAEEVVEFEVNDLTWNMAGTVLYGIGRILIPSQMVKLWAYNVNEGTVSTVCDNIMDSLDDVKALETLLDDTLLLGFTKNKKLMFWTLDVQTCGIIKQEEIATAYYDIKGLARPDCSYPYVDDAIFSNK